MKTKKIISVILALSLMLAVFVPAYGYDFKETNQIMPRYTNIRQFTISAGNQGSTIEATCVVYLTLLSNADVDIVLQKYSENEQEWKDYRTYSKEINGPARVTIEKAFTSLSAGKYRIKASIDISETPIDNDTIYSSICYI